MGLGQHVTILIPLAVRAAAWNLQLATCFTPFIFRKAIVDGIAVKIKGEGR